MLATWLMLLVWETPKRRLCCKQVCASLIRVVFIITLSAALCTDTSATCHSNSPAFPFVSWHGTGGWHHKYSSHGEPSHGDPLWRSGLFLRKPCATDHQPACSHFCKGCQSPDLWPGGACPVGGSQHGAGLCHTSDLLSVTPREAPLQHPHP